MESENQYGFKACGLATVPVVLQSLTVWQYKLLLQGLNWEPIPWTLGPPEQSVKRFAIDTAWYRFEGAAGTRIPTS